MPAHTHIDYARLNDNIIHAGNRYGATIQGTTTSFTVPPD